MAKIHVGKDVVISLDIKNFFTSIKQRRLEELFQSVGFDTKPARTLSELCTYAAFVPQGGLTSPKISNIVSATTFGPRIKEYCDREKLALTIYADDITVSFKGIRPVGPIIQELTAIVTSFGFRINREKTKVMTKGKRQYVCGVVVNKKTNLIRGDRLRLRAIVHNIRKNGVENEAAKSHLDPSKFIEVTRGKLNWFKQLNPILGGKLMARFTETVTPWLEQRKTEGVITVPTVVEPEDPSTGIELDMPWEG